MRSSPRWTANLPKSEMRIRCLMASSGAVGCSLPSLAFVAKHESSQAPEPTRFGRLFLVHLSLIRIESAIPKASRRAADHLCKPAAVTLSLDDDCSGLSSSRLSSVPSTYSIRSEKPRCSGIQRAKDGRGKGDATRIRLNRPPTAGGTAESRRCRAHHDTAEQRWR